MTFTCANYISLKGIGVCRATRHRPRTDRRYHHTCMSHGCHMMPLPGHCSAPPTVPSDRLRCPAVCLHIQLGARRSVQWLVSGLQGCSWQRYNLHLWFRGLCGPQVLLLRTWGRPTMPPSPYSGRLVHRFRLIS